MISILIREEYTRDLPLSQTSVSGNGTNAARKISVEADEDGKG